jgi:hypothetical protein
MVAEIGHSVAESVSPTMLGFRMRRPLAHRMSVIAVALEEANVNLASRSERADRARTTGVNTQYAWSIRTTRAAGAPAERVSAQARRRC